MAKQSDYDAETALRAGLVAWLEWNDSNGCYSDSDSIAEFGGVITTVGLVVMVHEQLPYENTGLHSE
jgi:hypothetical protein